MNSIEKKSFYSFLGLYLVSSFIFVLLSGYWYYTSEKKSLENTSYYTLQHIADTLSGHIIKAHMMQTKLHLPQLEEGYTYAFTLTEDTREYTRDYFEEKGFKVLVSSAPQAHLGVKYVVVKTDTFHKNVQILQWDVGRSVILVFVCIMLISWVLSKLFMRPVHQKMQDIEQFVQDISHELNTPITALSMSAKRGLQKKVYDENILRNISISTKQLYSIYKSLSYLNFSSATQEVELLNVDTIVLHSIEYYTELSMAKNIQIEHRLEATKMLAVDSRLELLFSNLLSNAIKYSMPDSTIYIQLKEGYFSIRDEGIGIAKDKLDAIFTLYERSSKLAGGFGVGLSIVKNICDSYKIDIQVDSQKDVGTEFILRWKL